ncbi:MAG: zinc metallopeptidase [Planctomycetes bacterium]|nr:zinc metallopeptidase [Planctomycetota bacterium]
MRFENQEESQNVDDRRGGGGGAPSGGGPGFGGFQLPMGRGGMGIGGLLIMLVVAWFAGINPLQLLSGNAQLPQANASQQQRRGGSAPVQESAVEGARAVFVKKVLATTETCWRDLFPKAFGKAYQDPVLVLFRDQVNSACGEAGASVGPFYCPGDKQVYIDLSFFDVMERQLGAKGDFAQAYVVAHEVGHHVQNLLGTNRKVQAMQRLGEREYNRASVKLELQADYYAGVWAHYVDKNLRGDKTKERVTIEPGDFEEAINAAQQIGDDTLQRKSTGTVVPEKFTHGTSAQRMKWFRLGFETGDPTAHDPFVEEK